MWLKRLFCSLLAMTLVFTSFGATVSAAEAADANESIVIARATERFTIDVPAGGIRQANTSFPLDPGEIVTINASYSPFSANVDFGLIAPNGRFYYVTATNGSVYQSIEISQRGDYVFAVRNNSSTTVNVTGYVNY